MNDKHFLQKLFRIINDDVSFVLKKNEIDFIVSSMQKTMNDVRISNEITLIDSIFNFQMIKFESIIDKKIFTNSYIFRRNNEKASLYFEIHHD